MNLLPDVDGSFYGESPFGILKGTKGLLLRLRIFLCREVSVPRSCLEPLRLRVKDWGTS